MARYPLAEWHPSPNTYGPGRPLSAHLTVIHVMQGTLDDTDSWFLNPANEVSAHFGIGRDGRVIQWVDTAEVAWHCCGYNEAAIGIEHEGFSGESLTPAQLAAGVELLRWIDTTHRIRMRRTANPAGNGTIGHGELGAVGCDHPDCPGGPILRQYAHATATPPEPAKLKTHPAHKKEHHVSIIPTTPKGTQQVSSLARQGAGIAAIVTSLTGTLPASLRTWGFLAGAIILVVEHYVGDPSTGTTPPTA